jgi:EAL domain-containing protein (putative c-di-GMP-specific phosphodiesterase class I)
MDDFGTGYSSLSYLRRFPFDRIKIDQSFVRDINSKRDCGAIIRAVTGLSRELEIATTAEGVETQAQLDALVSAGCTEFQGYLFSPPVTSGAVAGLRRSIAEMLRPALTELPALAELEV